MGRNSLDEREAHGGPGPIRPKPDNLVCPECGSAEMECLDWVRLNNNYFVGGNESMPADEYWCPDCMIHEKPVEAREYCGQNGHAGSPCTVCGT